MKQNIPVITIDGPSGTGKGTIAALLAEKLGYHLLDSGALYRALGWAVLQKNVHPENLNELSTMLDQLDLELKTSCATEAPEIWCDGQKINQRIREEAVGNMASLIAAIPIVRQHLVKCQRMMRQPPGLVADGRDMGSVIFPDATVKFYLDASPEIRANRRYNQLKKKGFNVSLREVREDLATRDYRDEHREIAPMIALPEMVWIDTSDLSIEAVFECVLGKLPLQL